MNDPNGLVVHDGLWHAYFQHNPEGADWGNMSWGHATSPDLQHWDEHPVALRYRADEQVYSGSVVVSGAGDASVTGDTPELTAYYTSAFADGRQAQSRAVSRDGGFTWERDEQNPVLDRGTTAFRDPKVVRHTDPDGRARWVMLAVEADDRQVLFYTSTDLRTWEHLSTFGPTGPEGVVWECPDLVRLPVDGRPDEVRWVLLLSTNPAGADGDPDGSSQHAVLGHFDGTSFTADDTGLRRLDHGRDFYAGVTFDNAPGGAAVMLGWMSNWRYAAEVPSSPWRGAMSLPRTLSLRDQAGRPVLVQSPPSFVIEQLRAATGSSVTARAAPFTTRLGGHTLLELRWDPRQTGQLRLRLLGEGDEVVEIVHDPALGALRCTRSGSATDRLHPDFASTSTAPLAGDHPAQLLLSLDGPLLELFLGAGEATISDLVLLGPHGAGLTLETAQESPVTTTVVEMPLSASPAARSA